MRIAELDQLPMIAEIFQLDRAGQAALVLRGHTLPARGLEHLGRLLDGVRLLPVTEREYRTGRSAVLNCAASAGLRGRDLADLEFLLAEFRAQTGLGPSLPPEFRTPTPPTRKTSPASPPRRRYRCTGPIAIAAAALTASVALAPAAEAHVRPSRTAPVAAASGRRYAALHHP